MGAGAQRIETKVRSLSRAASLVDAPASFRVSAQSAGTRSAFIGLAR
ncbi:hypothetical protein P873_07660 [Arenimonas composti TR7-09 = DSM 18010]|uniref:Uncharacterized protein n=1 Tax=Arenimonas composti TR7-09 = DSM 18010 TaxID=1121013 RepID=A0A091C0R3_9GAMM|nr:hypothetical protein P873_07660 [Arenimonas composti TR7-09 = DSM 18010]